jgi:hypothetical protein
MPRFAVLAAMLTILGSSAAYADTVLFTPMLSPPVGGSLECHVTNVGKKTLPEVRVALHHNYGAGGTSCPDLVSALIWAGGHTCSHTGSGSAFCKVTVTGGNHRSVRAVLNVVDSSGATILSVPATK